MKNISLEKFSKITTETKIIAILRGILPQDVKNVCEILIENGICLIEITLNSPDAFKSIGIAVDAVGKNAVIGAGTVLTVADVVNVAKAEGQFIISPNINVSVIKKSKELGLISIPGFLTPSEAFTAVEAGADMLKCFPAGTMGVSYLKDLKAVLKTPIVATGGIGDANIKGFLSIATGVGIGSALFKPGKTYEAIRADASQIVKNIKT
ncbi:MAG: 2-keto-3-deoxy-phosphogluconate aldolase [Candidatus Uhrbacteria bacterium GW2011_GWF2_39_13]|uniref:2-keto-3-deoxy-phosphogluconate aldolase n=1 Tax=Candidatus Uhrbacteria bacterium GW2011_GWF2_39_13 TaxID=1618995 RepID=A0A0G0QNT9_9BACT|nr:MAG: 2-keto-3-deoxy-phosphogluconate aldolase [Candidatus Uhrbacteria bacterium GW2011_GWF2_39_13]